MKKETSVMAISEPQIKAAVTIPTIESVTAQYRLELNKEGYQSVLQQAEDIVFAKETLQTDGEPLKKLRVIIKKIDELRAEKKSPYFEAGKVIDQAAKDLTKPLEEVLARKTQEYTKLAQEIKKELEDARIEKERVDGVKKEIDIFILNITQDIVSAENTSALSSIEMRMGSHKGNKSRYHEFLPDLVKRCDELTPMIKKQKEHINNVEELKKKEEEALAKGDDQAVLDARASIQEVDTKLEELKIRTQETAINQSTSIPSFVVPEVIMPQAVSARRTTWKAEIVDKKEVMKKSPDMVEVTLISSKVSETIKTLKDAGTLKGKTEFVMNGVRYFESALY